MYDHQNQQMVRAYTPSVMIICRLIKISFEPIIIYYCCMQNLQKENELLKGYVISLQRENQARNVERNTLFHEIDRLTLEIERLSAIKQNSRIITTTSTNSDRQVSTLKENISVLQKENEGLKAANAKLVTDLRSKTSENILLTQEQQRLTLQIKALKESNTSNTKIVSLENQISTYKIKITQITVLQQKLRTSTSKITDLQQANRRFENDNKKLEADLRRLQAEIRRLQNQNKDLKVSSRQSLQMSSLLSSKLNLEATIRQLNGKVQWLQSNNKNSDQQKIALEKRIKDLQKQVLDAKGKLTQMRFNEDSLKSYEASLSVKDKEMEALQQMIASLKENKKYLQKILREKEDIIVNLQAQISHNKTSHLDHFQRQIEQLTANNQQFQKQLTLQLKDNQQLQTEIRLLRGDKQKMQRDITLLTKSLDDSHKQINLLKYKTTQSTIPHFKPFPEASRNNEDLRMVVSSLKDELDELKASQQFRSQLLTNNPHHCESCHHVHLKNHLQKQSKSPQKVHPTIIVTNERDRSPINKAKWDNLQRKINALRSENETLKKSLFE